MNIQIHTPFKKASLWKFWFSMWVKPRATIRQVIETMSPSKVFWLILMLSISGNIWLNFGFFYKVLTSESYSLVMKRFYMAWRFSEMIGFIPVIILGIWGFSWLLKSFGKQFKSQATLKEIFYTNVWLVSFWGIFALTVTWCIDIFLIQVFKLSSIKPLLDSNWIQFLMQPYEIGDFVRFRWHYIILFVALLGFLWHYIIGLSEVMKISKTRVVGVTLPVVLVGVLWGGSFFICQTIRDDVEMQKQEAREKRGARK